MEDIKQIYQSIVNSINYDDISYKEDQGEWISAITVQVKNVGRFVENFKNADPFSILQLWNKKVIDYLNNNNPIAIGIRGNAVTALFSTPKKTEIDAMVYHAAYISSLLELFNFVLKRKNIRTFEIGIGISTDRVHISKSEQNGFPLVFEAIDRLSMLLAFEANKEGLERILIDDCTQFNLEDLVCYDGKKYKDVGVTRTSNLVDGTCFGYNLNLTSFSKWIEDFEAKDNPDNKQ